MRGRDTDLRLHEELLLIALHDDKGTIHHQAGMYQCALAAAILAELLLAERITVEDDRKRMVNVTSTRPIGDPLLDECLTRIETAKRRQRLQAWVQRVANTRQLRQRIAVGLCQRGVLREDEDRILWLFRRKLFPQRDPRHEKRIIERLRRAIFTETRTVAPRTAVLIALANGSGLLRIPFDRRELRARKQRLQRITEGQLLGRAMRDAIQAIQMVIIAAGAASAAAASTACT